MKITLFGALLLCGFCLTLAGAQTSSSTITPTGSSVSSVSSVSPVTAATTKTACVDQINPSTGKSDCPGLTAYCSNAIYQTLMHQQCPKTCGFCGSSSSSGVTSSGSCVDLTNPATGISDCSRVSNLCQNVNYQTLMRQQCPKTCGYCSSGSSSATSSPTSGSSCVDQINPVTGTSSCPGVASLCNDPTYQTLMHQQCPKTCGTCTGK